MMIRTGSQRKRSVVYFLDFADSLENADRVGSVSRIIRYFNALSSDSLKISIISPDLKDYSSHLTGGVHHPLPSFARVSRHIGFLILSPIIHANLLRRSDLYWAKFSSSIPAIVAKKLFRKPLLNYFDYNWVELSRESRETKLEVGVKTGIERFMIRNSDYFITTTDNLKADLVRKGFRYPERIFVIPNYVDTDVFCPRNECLGRSTVRVLSVGRLTEQKNFPLLIQSIARLQKSINPIGLTIVGSGPLKAMLQSYAAQLNVNLTIVDRVPNDDMPTVYRTHHVFVMTSPREGHPRALVEAMSCGLPVVGTNVVGIRDVVVDQRNGLLCSETSDDVAEKVSLVLTNPELSTSLGRFARQDAVHEYSFGALIVQERAILDQILRARHVL